jgi:DMSO/TMAO reductase YedYZ heme-binding membrane subunit
MARFWVSYLVIVAAFAAVMLLPDGIVGTVAFVALVAAIIAGFEIADRRSGHDSSTDPEPDRWDFLVMAAAAFVVFGVLESNEAELIAVVVVVPLVGLAARLARRRPATPDP